MFDVRLDGLTQAFSNTGSFKSSVHPDFWNLVPPETILAPASRSFIRRPTSRPHIPPISYESQCQQEQQQPRLPMSSCLFTPEQPPRQYGQSHHHLPQQQLSYPDSTMDSSNNTNWLAAGCDDDSDAILISPFQDIFPKREMFDDIDLSNIPMSLFTGQHGHQLAPSADVADISSSPTTLTPSSSISSASGTNSLGYDNSLFGPESSGFFSSPRPIDAQAQSVQQTPISTATVSEQPQQQQQHIRAPMTSVPCQVKIPSTGATTGSKPAPGADEPQAKAPEAQPAPSTPPQLARKLSLPPSSSHHSRFQTPPRKRKSTSASSSSSRSSTSPPPSGSSSTPSHPLRKTTHNMIEKRYRTNLNDKIAALRDAVPSLRLMAQRMDRDGNGLMLAGDGSGIIMDDVIAADVSLEVEQHMLGGLAPAHKLNKATVLSKATEYIAHLERNNQTLTREVGYLRNRLSGLEMMVMMQQQQSHPAPAQPHQPRSDVGYAGMW